MRHHIRDGRVRRAAREPLTDARRDLAARYLPFARSLARPYQARWPYLADEFESAACWGLCLAAGMYDEGWAVAFATYAKVPIRWAMTDVRRAQMIPRGYRNYPEERMPCVLSWSLDLLDPSGREPEVPEIDRVDAVEHWLRKLPRKHAAVCRLIYWLGMTHRAAALACHCSYAKIHRVNQESLAMLAESIGDADGGPGR